VGSWGNSNVGEIAETSTRRDWKAIFQRLARNPAHINMAAAMIAVKGRFGPHASQRIGMQWIKTAKSASVRMLANTNW
jgi:hypothetical protein